ncbi:MAG: TRAP transporter small permease subunit [Alphaproteobacteria bacterium]|nr:TRAP transporter small permease subunit [Alphaproteobacteria bacterium]
MRRALRALYDACGALAGASLVLMFAMIALNIAGGQFGFFIRGLDALAGYLMAAAIFLALPYTFKAGEHIRVTLLIQRLAPGARRAVEIGCLVVGLGLAALLAWASIRLAWLSWVFGDISQATDRMPLWIPQVPFAFGALMLAVAFLEDLVDALRGRRVPPRASDVPAHVE